MTTRQRIFTSLFAGLVTFGILTLLGFHPENMGAIIASAIGITALITSKFRNEKE